MSLPRMRRDWDNIGKQSKPELRVGQVSTSACLISRSDFVNRRECSIFRRTAVQLLVCSVIGKTPRPCSGNLGQAISVRQSRSGKGLAQFAAQNFS